MTHEEQMREAQLEIEIVERSLAERIAAGEISDDERADIESLIVASRAEYAIGLARGEAKALRGVAEPGHVAALEVMAAYAEGKR